MAYVIETSGLCRAFAGKLAVKNLDLKVEGGTFYGFLGPNGAGKSTTIKMLTGLLAPTSGSIRILGRNMLDPKEALQAKRFIGAIPENLALFDNLSGSEYLTFVGRIHGLERSEIRRRIEELLHLLTLEADRDKLTLDYSHGMRKKLSLAAALIANPALLFLDEPFEGVDAVASLTIRDLLNRFIARGGTVFLTSHVLEVVQKLCSHVGIIVGGQLVQQRSMEEILTEGSLEQSFLAAAGKEAISAANLDWLASSTQDPS